MIEEELKQKAEKHADAYATPDLENSFRVYIYEANKDGYIAGATEATAELEAQIEKMKNCRNCKNEKIEGACGHFTQVGWCKNWELAD